MKEINKKNQAYAIQQAVKCDRFIKKLENLRNNEDSNPLLMIVTLN